MAGNRKISQEAANAFENGRNMTKSNTSVMDGVLSLHGNAIAKFVEGDLFVTLAGWNTPTTRERLNALRGVGVHVKQYQPYLNDKPWNGEWVKVSDFN